MAVISPQQLRALRVIDRQQRAGGDGHDCEREAIGGTAG